MSGQIPRLDVLQIRSPTVQDSWDLCPTESQPVCRGLLSEAAGELRETLSVCGHASPMRCPAIKVTSFLFFIMRHRFRRDFLIRRFSCPSTVCGVDLVEGRREEVSTGREVGGGTRSPLTGEDGGRTGTEVYRRLPVGSRWAPDCRGSGRSSRLPRVRGQGPPTRPRGPGVSLAGRDSEGSRRYSLGVVPVRIRR